MIEENKSNAVPGWSYCEYANAYRKLENENTKLKDELAKPIAEHPDVQRLIGQVVELQAENAKLKEENRTAASLIKRFIVVCEALKGGCWE